MGKYEDQICQAVDVITQQKLNNAVFDRTLEATIVSCENPETGKYLVKYQDANFIAFAKGTDKIYEQGTSVYVLVPSNNTEKDKIIVWAGEKNNVNVIKSKEQNSSGFFGSGVGRFTNPEKNSELFNDYKNSKVDKSARYCHVEGQKQIVKGSLSHCHIGGYDNTVSKNSDGYNSFIQCGGSTITDFNSSFIIGSDLKITSSRGVFISGYHHELNNVNTSIIFGNTVKATGLNSSIIGGLNIEEIKENQKQNNEENEEEYTVEGSEIIDAAIEGAVSVDIKDITNTIIVGSNIKAKYIECGCYTGGNYSIAYGSQYSLVGGHDHGSSDSPILVKNSLLIGYNNYTYENSVAGGNIIGGFGNTLRKNQEGSIVSGYSNNVNAKASLAIGWNNIINGYVHGSIIGGYANNIKSQGLTSIVEGMNNTLSAIESSIVCGHTNNISWSRFSFIGGLEHKISEGESSGIFAQKILAENGSIKRSLVSGFNNTIATEVTQSCIAGQDHIITGSGLNNSCIFGFHNEWNSQGTGSSPVFVIGQWAKQDRGNYAFVIGNGSGVKSFPNYKSNAFAVDTEGNVYCKSINRLPPSGGGSSTDLTMFYTKEESDLYFSKIDKGTVFPEKEEEADEENGNIKNPLLGDIFFLQEEKIIEENKTETTILEYKEPYICTPKGWEKLFYDDTNKITYKGIVETIENLPSEENKVGDLYLVKKYKSSSEEDNLEFLCYMEYLFTENGWEPIYYKEEKDNRILLQLKGTLNNEEELKILTDNQEGDSYFILEKNENNLPIAYQYIYFNSQWIKIGGKYIDENTLNKAIEELNGKIETINSDVSLVKDDIKEINGKINTAQTDIDKNKQSILTIDKTLDDFDNRISKLESDSPSGQDAVYLTNIEFISNNLILTNSLNQTETCTIEEEIDAELNKEIMTITNTNNGKVLTISWSL